MSDEPMDGQNRPPTPEFHYDSIRCNKWSRRIMLNGLEAEWQQFRAKHYRSTDNKAENKRRFCKVQMLFVARLEEVESDRAKADAQPGAVRKKGLENLIAQIPADRRSSLQKDRDWAGNSLNIPVNKLEEPPSRRAVSILLAAEDDPAFRRSLLTEQKKTIRESGDGDDHDSTEPEVDEQTQQIINRARQLE